VTWAGEKTVVAFAVRLFVTWIQMSLAETTEAASCGARQQWTQRHARAQPTHGGDSEGDTHGDERGVGGREDDRKGTDGSNGYNERTPGAGEASSRPRPREARL
jgi:hypothetical protein